MVDPAAVVVTTVTSMTSWPVTLSVVVSVIVRVSVKIPFSNTICVLTVDSSVASFWLTVVTSGMSKPLSTWADWETIAPSSLTDEEVVWLRFAPGRSSPRLEVTTGLPLSSIAVLSWVEASASGLSTD